MKYIDIQNAAKELEFVTEAIDAFKQNKAAVTTYSTNRLAEGTLFAVRWGLENDCLLVFRVGDEPRIYKQVLTPVLSKSEPLFYIGVEYDHDCDWIVTLPAVYSDGIEQETDSRFLSIEDARERATEISKNTGLPIVEYDLKGVRVKK